MTVTTYIIAILKVNFYMSYNRVEGGRPGGAGKVHHGDENNSKKDFKGREIISSYKVFSAIDYHILTVLVVGSGQCPQSSLSMNFIFSKASLFKTKIKLYLFKILQSLWSIL